MASASINLDGGNILEEKAEIFYHELFSRHLRVPHATFVIAHAVIMLQDGGGGRGGSLGLSSSVSSNGSSSLSLESLVGERPAAVQCACQDGRGPQSLGRSGSGGEG